MPLSFASESESTDTVTGIPSNISLTSVSPLVGSRSATTSNWSGSPSTKAGVDGLTLRPTLTAEMIVPSAGANARAWATWASNSSRTGESGSIPRLCSTSSRLICASSTCNSWILISCSERPCDRSCSRVIWAISRSICARRMIRRVSSAWARSSWASASSPSSCPSCTTSLTLAYTSRTCPGI